MNRLFTGALLGTLGWLAAARAEDFPHGPATACPALAVAASRSPSGVTLGRPVVVSLGRPVLATAEAPRSVDPGVTLASYQWPATLAAPIVRMQGADGRSTWVSGEEQPVPPGGSQFASGSAPPAIRTAGFAAGPLPANSGPVTSSPLGASTAPFGGAPAFAEEGCCACDGLCCDECCPDGCGRRGCCFYGSAEFLLWALRDQHFPALVTTGSALRPLGGVLGDSSTQVLFGGGSQAVHSNEFSGGRFTVGWWCDSCETKGIEASYFFLGEKTIHFGASSDQFPLLGRPFFDPTSPIGPTESAELTAFPGLSTGRVDVVSSSRLWGTEANLRCRVCCDTCCCDCLEGCGLRTRLDLLAGVRYVDLTEGLSLHESVLIQQNLTFSPFDPAGTQAFVTDSFGTRNQFYGGQVGADLNFCLDRWSLDLLGKLALGDTHQVINIEGETMKILPSGVVQTAQGGLLALASNSGRFSRDRFTVLPELGIKLGYHVTDNLQLTVGYTFMYWSSVVRPGDQIDRVLDSTSVPSFFRNLIPPVAVGSRPEVLFRGTDFWAQGVSFGLEYNY